MTALEAVEHHHLPTSPRQLPGRRRAGQARAHNHDVDHRRRTYCAGMSEQPSGPVQDASDKDTVERYDLDVDGDGVLDGTEVVETRYLDVDEDGVADMVVVTDTIALDVDHDGRADAVVVTETVGMDVTGDGRVDAVEVTRTTLRDADGDGTFEVVGVEELDVTEVPVPPEAEDDDEAPDATPRPELDRGDGALRRRGQVAGSLPRPPRGRPRDRRPPTPRGSRRSAPRSARRRGPRRRPG